MKYLEVGKIVNTHGIKGELRIISNIDHKDEIFKVDNKLYIGNNYEENIIMTYRVHKNYDMVLFKGYSNINEVLKYKGCSVYINEDDYDVLFVNLLIGYKIKNNNKYYGKVKEIVCNKIGYLLKIDYHNEYFIPYNEHFITNIDTELKEIIVSSVEELII